MRRHVLAFNKKIAANSVTKPLKSSFLSVKTFAACEIRFPDSQ